MRFVLDAPPSLKISPFDGRPEAHPKVINTRRSNDARVPGGRISMAEAGVVYIGKKPTMNYVLAVVTHFNDGSREVIVKARGRSISRAVDVAEIVRERFIPDAEVRDVRISTEKVASEQGAGTNVSSIEIVLSK